MKAAVPISSKSVSAAAAGGTRVLFAGGGTGGHLMPAVAAAEALRRIDSGTECFFLTSRRALGCFRPVLEGFRTFNAPEMRWLGPLSAPALVFKSALSMTKTYELFRACRPDVVVGMGGWGCAPAVVCARLMRIPSILFEANAVAGCSVKLLSRFSDAVQLQWGSGGAGLDRRAAKLPVGTPVRRALFRGQRRRACKKYGLNPCRSTLLVMGGTQGALALNRLCVESFRHFGLDSLSLQVLHLTGSGHRGEFEKFQAPAGITYRPVGFEENMCDAYSVADLVLCRAGGGTLAEISALGIPALLVPYPYAAGRHQLANAKKLAETGGALLIEQHHATAQRLADIITTLVTRKDLRLRMKARSRAAGHPHADRETAQAILSLAKKKTLVTGRARLRSGSVPNDLGSIINFN